MMHLQALVGEPSHLECVLLGGRTRGNDLVAAAELSLAFRKLEQLDGDRGI
jgi:hypothetical protein